MLKGKRTKGSVYQSFLICLILSAAVMVIMAILCALVAGALDDPTKHLALMSLGVMLMSAAVSGVVSSRMQNGSIAFSALVALALVLIMLLIDVIVCKGKVSLGAFMNYGCYMGVATMSAFLGRKKEKHKRHKR